MLVSNVSRKTMKKTGTAKTFTILKGRGVRSLKIYERISKKGAYELL